MKTVSSIIAGVALIAGKTTSMTNNTMMEMNDNIVMNNHTMITNEFTVSRRLVEYRGALIMHYKGDQVSLLVLDDGSYDIDLLMKILQKQPKMNLKIFLRRTSRT